MVRQNKLFEVALMELIGSSEGSVPYYTPDQRLKYHLTHGEDKELILLDYPIRIIVSSKEQHKLDEFCEVSKVFGREGTYSQMLKDILRQSDKFKASYDTKTDIRRVVFGHTESNFFVMIEGLHKDIQDTAGPQLHALHLRCTMKEKTNGNTSTGDIH